MTPKSNKKLIVFALALGLVLPGSFLTRSFGGVSNAPRIRAIDNPCLKFFPRDAWAVGNIDVKAFIDFLRTGNEQNPAMDMMLQQYGEMIRGFTGIDVRTEVSYLAFCLSGTRDADLRGLVIVKGSFDGAISEMRLNLGIGSGLQRTAYSGKTLYENQQMGYALPESSTLAIGTPSLLRTAVDAINTGARPMSGPFQKTLAKTNGASLVWVAMKPNVLLEANEIAAERQQNPEIFTKLSTLQCASLFSQSAADGLLVTALGCTSDQQHAQELHSFLTSTKRDSLEVSGANVFLGSFLVLSDIALDGEFVQWDLHLTVQGLEKLWETKFIKKIRDRANAGM